jgi:hypothetical protein
VVPPFVGVAVNVILVPAQIPVADAAMFTEGVTWGVTAIVIEFDWEVLVDAQVALLVSSHLITSPLTRPLLL